MENTAILEFGGLTVALAGSYPRPRWSFDHFSIGQG